MDTYNVERDTIIRINGEAWRAGPSGGLRRAG